jgi:GNAT superfamily N-acetyltransferase
LLIDAGEMTVARLLDRIIGCIRIQQLDSDTGEFGMLVAATDRRGIGVGRSLVEFAEQKSLDSHCRTMQLELLVPRAWTHPSKEFLRQWYTRIGYVVSRTGTIDDAYPHLVPQLATDCDFVIYRKGLVG